MMTMEQETKDINREDRSPKMNARATHLKPRKVSGFTRWISAFVIFLAVGVGWEFLPPAIDYLKYEPKDGDVVFQSLSRSPLTNTIEGATHSPYSHCGLVVEENGRWYVYEALGNVNRTSLRSWFFRSRDRCFAAFRLDDDHQQHVPKMIEYVRKCQGLPYDMRYRMDDESIYCSELVFKAYRHATGEGLGKLVKLGDLDWKPYRAIIEQLEGGPAPTDREMITPRDLAKAEELKLVMKTGH